MSGSVEVLWPPLCSHMQQLTCSAQTTENYEELAIVRAPSAPSLQASAWQAWPRSFWTTALVVTHERARGEQDVRHHGDPLNMLEVFQRLEARAS